MPDFDEYSMNPPLVCPYCAEKLVVMTFTSWTLSTGGDVVARRGGARIRYAFPDTGLHLVFRPRQPTDQLQLVSVRVGNAVLYQGEVDFAALRASDQPLDVFNGSGRGQVVHSTVAARGFGGEFLDRGEVVARRGAGKHSHAHVAQARPRVQPGHERREQSKYGEEDRSLRARRQRTARQGAEETLHLMEDVMISRRRLEA